MTASMIGKVALVTGGSSGIGRAAAYALAAEGACVVIASRNQLNGQKAAAEIQQSERVRLAGGEVHWLQLDVSQSEQVDAVIDEIIRTYHRLDYAFNNGGSGARGKLLHQVPNEDFDSTINGFLKSVFLCMRAEIRVMLELIGMDPPSVAPCAIVNNSSVEGERANPYNPVYSASKHGVLGLTKSAAVQYIQKGIRINAICPGWIMTPSTIGLTKDPEAVKRIIGHHPNGRFGTAEEVGETVVWLCSEESSMIVGAALAVDGGYLAV